MEVLVPEQSAALWVELADPSLIGSSLPPLNLESTLLFLRFADGRSRWLAIAIRLLRAYGVLVSPHSTRTHFMCYSIVGNKSRVAWFMFYEHIIYILYIYYVYIYIYIYMYIYGVI